MFQSMNYIYEIYKTGSFSKAAKNLYLTQPALSIAVKKEEKELGQPIFDRSSSSIRLTEAGKAYIESVETIRKTEASLRLYCNDLSNLKTGKLRLGASSFLLSQIVLPVISQFSEQYPGITVDVQEAPSLELKNRILTDKLDIIVDPMSFEENLVSSRHLYDDYFLLAVPKNRPINRKLPQYVLTREQILKNFHLKPDFPEAPLHLFSEEDFLFMRPETVTFARATKICDHYGFKPKIKFYLDQQSTCYHFVLEGLGCAFITDAVVKKNTAPESALFYKLDPALAKREIAAVYKKNRYMSKASLEFLSLAEKLLSLSGNQGRSMLK